MSDPFARMTKSIFTRLGGGAFLRVDEACDADVHFGVAVSVAGEYGDLTAYRTVANIRIVDIPKPCTGDKITVSGRVYTLDALLKDDGYSTRWIVNDFIP
jgi:hypothetical protein